LMTFYEDDILHFLFRSLDILWFVSTSERTQWPEPNW
jgi:hypothetical protein